MQQIFFKVWWLFKAEPDLNENAFFVQHFYNKAVYDQFQGFFKEIFVIIAREILVYQEILIPTWSSKYCQFICNDLALGPGINVTDVLIEQDH